MAPNPKVAMAFNAMGALGIPVETVKPVLKNLLKLYDKNWDFIEEENYRALADAIFEYQEAKEAEEKKNHVDTDRVEEKEETCEPRLKRLRLRHQEDRVSPAICNSSLSLTEISMRRPKLEDGEVPQTSLSKEIADPYQLYDGDERTDWGMVSPPANLRDKGKEPVSSRSPSGCEGAEASHACLRQRRAESNNLSPQACDRDKGKEPVSPQIAHREKRSISERASRVLCYKEPKIDPGIVLSPKLKVPKSEPLDDDLPQLEVPIAVIHPDPPYNMVSTFENDCNEETDGQRSVASQFAVAEEKIDGVSDSACKAQTNMELVNVSEASPCNVEIASSPLGEVKISLSCNSALGRPDFHMPSLESVLKLVEDKCLKSYRIKEPNFSLVKVLKQFCECFLEIGTDCTDDECKKSNKKPSTADLLRKSNSRNVLGASINNLGKLFIPESSLDGSIKLSSELARPQLSRFLSLNSLDGQLMGNGNEKRDKMKDVKDPECSKSNSLVVVQQHHFTSDDVRLLHDVNDITKGEEAVKISWFNEVSSECPSRFYYIPQSIVYQNAYVNFSLARIGDEDCCSHCFGDCLSSSIPCACARETGGEFAYTLEGLIREEFLKECISMNHNPQQNRLVYCKDCPLERSKNEDLPDPCKGHYVRKFIKECWSKCGCNKQCGNRVVQRGITCNLQVFLASEGKGWGLRTLEDLPKGTFVCEYVGEILTNMELYERNMRSTGNEKHTYPVYLDADWGSENVLKDEEALCLDATYYGNVARFINHRCVDANLIEIPVEVETPDHHYYHLAFFTTKAIDALEELTWDYGIDFDDHNHPVKAFRCRCGSKFCRDMKRSNRNRSRALILN